jgi:hypothetical protein
LLVGWLCNADLIAMDASEFSKLQTSCVVLFFHGAEQNGKENQKIIEKNKLRKCLQGVIFLAP